MSKTSPPNVPAPPRLDDDVWKLVFTHRSLFSEPVTVGSVKETCNWDRLAFRGEGILFSAVSNFLPAVFPDGNTTWMKVRTLSICYKSFAIVGKGTND